MPVKRYTFYERSLFESVFIFVLRTELTLLIFGFILGGHNYLPVLL